MKSLFTLFAFLFLLISGITSQEKVPSRNVDRLTIAYIEKVDSVAGLTLAQKTALSRLYKAKVMALSDCYDVKTKKAALKRASIYKTYREKEDAILNSTQRTKVQAYRKRPRTTETSIN